MHETLTFALTGGVWHLSAAATSTTPAFTVPTVPAIVVLLVNFGAPYLVSVVQSPLWPKNAKKIASVIVSVLLTAIVLVVAHFGFAFVIPAWPELIILGIVCCAFSYSVLLKDSADAITNSTGTGTAQGVPNQQLTGTAQSTATPPVVSSAPSPTAQPTPSGTTIIVGSKPQ